VAAQWPGAAMTLRFTKMQGLGNDFVVVDGVSQHVDLTPDRIRALADRRFGVGCDQVLVVERAQGDADFRYRIFNADGFEVEQCGNGARCFVVFVRDHGLTDKRELRVETAGGLIVPRLETDGQVTVDMGVLRFRPKTFRSSRRRRDRGDARRLGRPMRISALSMGNPHAVQIVSDVEAAPVTTQGPLMENHRRFQTA
jgi:diaminopimelate epimerase